MEWNFILLFRTLQFKINPFSLLILTNYGCAWDFSKFFLLFSIASSHCIMHNDFLFFLIKLILQPFLVQGRHESYCYEIPSLIYFKRSCCFSKSYYSLQSSYILILFGLAKFFIASLKNNLFKRAIRFRMVNIQILILIL